MPRIGRTFYNLPAEPLPPQLPVFVYGTLRPGCGNYRLLAGATTAERTATISGYRMVSNGGFPYILNDTPESVVTGTLVDVDPALWERVLPNLDALEGTPHHYERLVQPVQVDGETVEAYVYVPPKADQHLYADLAPIESGNWEDRPAPVYARRAPYRPAGY